MKPMKRKDKYDQVNKRRKSAFMHFLSFFFISSFQFVRGQNLASSNCVLFCRWCEQYKWTKQSSFSVFLLEKIKHTIKHYCCLPENGNIKLIASLLTVLYSSEKKEQDDKQKDQENVFVKVYSTVS